MGSCCSSPSSQNVEKPQKHENKSKPAEVDKGAGLTEKKQSLKKEYYEQPKKETSNVVATSKKNGEDNFMQQQGNQQEPVFDNDANKRERAERKIKGKVIFNDDEGDKLEENIVKVDKKMTRDDVQFVIVSLMKHFFFRNLSDDEL